MTESLLPKEQSKKTGLCSKVVCGGLGIVVLTGVLALYSMSAGESPTIGKSNAVVREISGEVNVKALSSMKTEWSHYNEVSLQVEKLTPYVMHGKLVTSEYETSFQVSQIEKAMTIVRKNTVTGKVEETLYSEQSKTTKAYEFAADSTNQKAKTKEEAVYQFTDKQGTVTDGFEAFQKYMLSDLLLDTYLTSLKLAQFGLTGKSAPVIKGFHNIAQTLAKQTDHAKRFTAEMAALVKEINGKIFEEKEKPATESLLWVEGKANQNALFGDKLMIGPCDRYANCTCEIENRSKSCGNPCFGLCGPNCDCWAFICGDCDCHCFCYNHDGYCSCISMLDYHCWNIWLWFDACC